MTGILSSSVSSKKACLKLSNVVHPLSVAVSTAIMIRHISDDTLLPVLTFNYLFHPFNGVGIVDFSSDSC